MTLCLSQHCLSLFFIATWLCANNVAILSFGCCQIVKYVLHRTSKTNYLCLALMLNLPSFHGTHIHELTIIELMHEKFCEKQNDFFTGCLIGASLFETILWQVPSRRIEISWRNQLYKEKKGISSTVEIS